MAQKILIVEDEEKIARFVELELLHEGYEAEKVFDGRTGLDKALSGGFDLVVLDVRLPGLNGLEVLRRIRKESDVPVIMLTARDAVMDKVSGLDAGADDYLTKPFAIGGAACQDKGCVEETRSCGGSHTQDRDPWSVHGHRQA